jgi:hypothetical protein
MDAEVATSGRRGWRTAQGGKRPLPTLKSQQILADSKPHLKHRAGAKLRKF